MNAPWRRGLVVGLGKSGQAVVRLLTALGVHVVTYDRNPSDALDGVDHAFDGPVVPDAAFEGTDLLVLSPGVPPEPIREVAARCAPEIEIHGELGLALSLVDRGIEARWPRVPTVLITGTNGKSTVTAMMGALLQAAGRTPFVGGNFGAPLCDVLADRLQDSTPWPTDLVLECSSFQLETLPTIETQVAMLLNVTPDHLDRYESLEHYARTKARVFGGLRDDGLALVLDHDAWTHTLAPQHPNVVRVGSANGPRVVGDGADEMLQVASGEALARATLPLPGGHNAVNAVFAMTAARHLGVTMAQCTEALRRFEGLPHRMVRVRELDGVVFYNDSKATNVASALASLGGLDRPFVLIAGGKAKGDDLAPLGKLIAERAQGLVTIGEAGPSFAALADGLVATQAADDLTAAVSIARAMAQPGVAVVLAPACASYDQFDSYAHRGRVFTEAVLAL